ncbi:hypothetical protein DYB28_011352, partial [Aphanomyces astaci]
MTLDYTATSQVDATAALTPFLTSAPSDLELLGEFELDMPLQDLLDTYYADPPDGAEASANPVWAQYIKERGDTEVTFQIKVQLHDIPYGDIFTVEHSMTLTKSSPSNNNGVSVKVRLVYLAIPFSSGCMFKSKILSQTKTATHE